MAIFPYKILYGTAAVYHGDISHCATTDHRGVARPKDGDGNGSASCDIGAFEFDPAGLDGADNDGDGYSNALELALGKNPNTACPIMRADVNMDGVVSILDFVLEAASFGQAIPPA